MCFLAVSKWRSKKNLRESVCLLQPVFGLIMDENNILENSVFVLCFCSGADLHVNTLQRGMQMKKVPQMQQTPTLNETNKTNQTKRMKVLKLTFKILCYKHSFQLFYKLRVIEPARTFRPKVKPVQ